MQKFIYRRIAHNITPATIEMRILMQCNAKDRCTYVPLMPGCHSSYFRIDPEAKLNHILYNWTYKTVSRQCSQFNANQINFTSECPAISFITICCANYRAHLSHVCFKNCRRTIEQYKRVAMSTISCWIKLTLVPHLLCLWNIIYIYCVKLFIW